MPVTTVVKDPEALTMTVTVELPAPVERAWSLWSDPRQLERWWGPPTYPATFVEHDLQPGGTVTYFMTSPEGEEYHGWWKVLEADPPRRLAFHDGFGDAPDNPAPDMPVTSGVVTFTADGAGSRMTIETTFASVEDMTRILEMGMEEGLTAALGQIDAILAAD